MISFFARGDSSTANNSIINVQNTNTTPTTTLSFQQGNWNAILKNQTGTFYVDGELRHYQLEFSGTLPLDYKDPTLAGQQMVVLTDTDTGQRYFFFTSSSLNADTTTMDNFQNGAISLDSVVYLCFLRGTLIETVGGPKPVETIVPGDLVATDEGPLPVAWVGSQTLYEADFARDPDLAPVRIETAALGPNRPASPLSLSPDHRVVLEGADVELALGTHRAFCAAKFLVGRPGVTQDTPVGPVEYFHILLSSHRILTAQGLECESLSHGPRAREALGDALCDRLETEGVLKAGEGRSPLPVLKRFEAAALA